MPTAEQRQPALPWQTIRTKPYALMKRVKSMALHLKLNELVAATALASNRMIDVEDLTEDELTAIRKYYSKLKTMAQKVFIARVPLYRKADIPVFSSFTFGSIDSD